MDKEKWEHHESLLSGLPYRAVREFEVEEKGKKKKKVEIEFENPPLSSKPDFETIPLIFMVRTERISTHDIQRGDIPFKDQVLALNHNMMRRMVAVAVGTSQIDVPGLEDNSVVIAAEQLEPVDFENVLRAYMAKTDTSTSLYHHYVINGRRTPFCGHELPDNLVPNGKLPYIMDTPSTKSDIHDESVTPETLYEKDICTEQEYRQIRSNSLQGFVRAAVFLEGRGIILADTKEEDGKNQKGEIVSKDELYTMDSSRFWRADDYNIQLELFLAGKDEELEAYLNETQPGLKREDYVVNGRVIICPRSMSKEFARGFSKGAEGYDDEARREIAVRYVEGIQDLTGQRFVPDVRPKDERVISGLETAVNYLVA
jgi:phosphoribosylaminoimidazole-succinocarboxamide synthase